MPKLNKKSLALTTEEVIYLKSLLDEEIFKLEGVTKVMPKKRFKNLLFLAEGLNKKVIRVSTNVTASCLSH